MATHTVPRSDRGIDAAGSHGGGAAEERLGNRAGQLGGTLLRDPTLQ
jgi:hypothetical protein